MRWIKVKSNLSISSFTVSLRVDRNVGLAVGVAICGCKLVATGLLNRIEVLDRPKLRLVMLNLIGWALKKVISILVCYSRGLVPKSGDFSQCRFKFYASPLLSFWLYFCVGGLCVASRARNWFWPTDPQAQKLTFLKLSQILTREILRQGSVTLLINTQ